MSPKAEKQGRKMNRWLSVGGGGASLGAGAEQPSPAKGVAVTGAVGGCLGVALPPGHGAGHADFKIGHWSDQPSLW